MSNGYDTGTVVIEILDSYLDNKSKERIAYAKLNKPEIRTVDDRLYSIDPATSKATDITPNSTSLYNDKAMASYLRTSSQWDDPEQKLSSSGVATDIDNSLMSGIISKKGLDAFNSGLMKRYSKVASLNVAGQYKGIMLREDIPSEVFHNRYGSFGYNEAGNLEANGELDRIIRSGSPQQVTQFLSNVNKFATQYKRNQLATKIEEAGKQRTEVKLAQMTMTSSWKNEEDHFGPFLTWMKDKSGNVINIDEIRAGEKITEGLVNVVRAESDYIRALTGNPNIVNPLNIYNYQDDVQNAGRIMPAIDKVLKTDPAEAKKVLETEFLPHENGPITVNDQKGYLTINGLKWINERSKSLYKGNTLTLNSLPYVHAELWFNYDKDRISKLLLQNEEMFTTKIDANKALLESLK